MSNNGYSKDAPRRSSPTFLLTAQPPSCGKAWADKPFAARVKEWCTETTCNGNTLPHAIYFAIVLKIWLYIYLYTDYVMDPAQPWSAELNVKRFILYNIFGDVLGLNSTNGTLGFRFKFPFVTWYNFITPGTLTSPLMPGVKAIRTIWLVAGYFVYLALLVRGMLADSIGMAEVSPIVTALVVLTLFDCTIAHASRGEHYGYMMFCLMFTGPQWVFGCQCCQIALWTWAGMAKVGPWFPYVTAQMTPNCFLLRPLPSWVLKLLSKDHPRDLNPSRLCAVLAYSGVLLEITCGSMCAYGPTRMVGVAMALTLHLYITSMLPFASVMEWNVYCMWSIKTFFYDPESAMSVPADLHPALAAFLVVALVLVPAVGQLYPKMVPFLFAFRPYAGNWRMAWVIVKSGDAAAKLNKLKTLDSVFIEENAKLLMGSEPESIKQMDYFATGNMVIFPHFRPIVPIVEKLQQLQGWGHADDFHHIYQEGFLNAVLGWPAFFAAMQEKCGFAKGECFVAIFEPNSPVHQVAEWKVVDIADSATYDETPVIHGSCPYSELEKFQPAGVPVSFIEKMSML